MIMLMMKFNSNKYRFWGEGNKRISEEDHKLI